MESKQQSKVFLDYIHISNYFESLLLVHPFGTDAMKKTTDLIQTLEDETDAQWTAGHDTNTYTEIESESGEVVTVSAWDSNELTRWNVTLRQEADAEPVVPDEIPVETDDLEEVIQRLV